MAEVFIKKITEKEFIELVDKHLEPESHRNARELASIFHHSTNPESYHIIRFNSPSTDELCMKTSALLRVIASSDDESAIALVKFVIAPIEPATVKTRQGTYPNIKSGLLFRDGSLDYVINHPNLESWSDGSRAFATLQTTDPYPSSAVGRGGINIDFARQSRELPTLQVNEQTRLWFADRVLSQLF